MNFSELFKNIDPNFYIALTAIAIILAVYLIVSVLIACKPSKTRYFSDKKYLEKVVRADKEFK